MSNSGANRQFLWHLQGGLCHYCKRMMTLAIHHPTLTCTVDHVIPVAHGGRHERRNYVGACTQCNNARGTMPAALFTRYVRRFGPADVSRIHRSNWYKRKFFGIDDDVRAVIAAPPPVVNDVMKQKMEAAVRAKIAALDAAGI